jgi:hypothetical protein
MRGTSRSPSSSHGAWRLSLPLRCSQSPSIGAANGSLGHRRRPTSHRWARRRCIPLPSPSHGSCTKQVHCYDCKPATIRHGVRLWMTLHIPVAEAKSICTPSSHSAIGGILLSQTAVLAAYLSPHWGSSSDDSWVTSEDPEYSYIGGLHPSKDEVGHDNWAIDPGLVKQSKQLLHLHHLGASRSH